ncbi:metallophosphoesterase [Gemmata sp. JC717]|uniref:metallophosphoesterase family protein n=1 Tax=Gemmata algarum TaxID=2975278 RepID=UPI0021BA7841|nr:metallophosphoesterase [Gemmata algarum]MDY3556164.1 metallophosphoesterase [Gemmata algarum]
MTLTVAAISDLHGHLPAVPACDLLLIAGDICPSSWPGPQAGWLAGAFRRWLDAVPAREVVAVAGNHDWAFESWDNRRAFEVDPGGADPLVLPGLRWHYLEDRAVEVFGLRIYGTPWQLRCGNWAFNVDEPVLAERFARIPDDTDIVLSHSPPFGIGDLAPRRNGGGEHVGSPSLLDRVRRVRPRLHVFGHIHEARGRWQEDGTTFANVSVLDGRYDMVHQPMVFKINTSRDDTGGVTIHPE